MPGPTLLVELVASICLSFSLSLPPMSAWGFLCYFFLIFFLTSKKECRWRQGRCDARAEESRCPSWISVMNNCHQYQILISVIHICHQYQIQLLLFLSVLNFCHEYQSVISAMNSCHEYQILNQKEKILEGKKVGLREMKKTERKRSEGEKLDISNHWHNKNTHETCLSKCYKELSVSIYLNLEQRWAPQIRMYCELFHIALHSWRWYFCIL